MSFCQVYAPNGALICQPRATPGELDAAWIRPRRGQKNDTPHYRVAKGVSGIIILLPILGECWLRTIPKALPWADLFLAFQAVFPPTVYTPLPWGNRRSRFACRRKGSGGYQGKVYAPNGALICQPRATPGELDAAGIRPRRGQKNDSPPLESGKGSEWNNNSFAHSGRM